MAYSHDRLAVVNIINRLGKKFLKQAIARMRWFKRILRNKRDSKQVQLSYFFASNYRKFNPLKGYRRNCKTLLADPLRLSLSTKIKQ